MVAPPRAPKKISHCGDGSFSTYAIDGVEEPVVEPREDCATSSSCGAPAVSSGSKACCQAVYGWTPTCSPHGSAEPAQRLDERLALLRVARVEQREHDDLLAVDLRREERQRRRLAQDGPHGELVRRLGDEFAVLLQHRLRLGERVDDEAAQHVRARPGGAGTRSG